MSPKINFARIYWKLRDFYSARRDNFAVSFAMAALTIIGAGCGPDHSNQVDSGRAATQTDANSASRKLLPKSAPATNSQLHPNAFQSLRSADDNTEASAINSSTGGSSVVINGWQYCLAPSHAEHKVYVSSPFPKSTELGDAEATFSQMLLQVQHGDVQCPIGNDEGSISTMRQHAISFNRTVGNTIVALNWEPSKIFQPEGKDAVNDEIYTGKASPSADDSAWQYCVAPSYAENKIYISPPFPKRAALSKTETAFSQMLFQSEIRHDDVQCPNGKDEPSISDMREHAINFNRDLGNTITTLNWKP